ncbi:rhamnogalacturonan acetylesterase [Maribacter sp. CXY002]|uniref:rhamnogalacturonan acetylesterase n=1 Tax=Maribacter luteocoastalis TaxID=3407671 RepID=UPI003B66C8B7
MNKLLFSIFFLSGIASLTAQDISIYCIGDSTMADKKNPEENPEHGWCQVLPKFFMDDIRVDNRAVNGRSSKSFIDEGRWQNVYDSLKEGDYVFIQFGHNDQKFKDSTRYTNPHTSYRHNLIRFINESREKGAFPILFSSIVRRNFNEFGTLIDTHGEYPLETRLVAQELKVPFIDLNYLTEIMETNHGVKGSKELHLHFKPGDHPYYPDGKEDNTHLSRKGALLVAEMAVKELKKQRVNLATKLK